MDVTVYLVQDALDRNFAPAFKWGEIHALFPHHYQVQINCDYAVDQLRQKLAKFGNDDYLLLSGDPVLMGLAITVALEINSGYATLLKWDRQTKQYLTITVMME